MLTAKKRAFIDYYKLTRNASESARKAGYSEKFAGTSGYRVLKDAEISAILSKWEQGERERIEAQARELNEKCKPSRSNYLERTFLKAETISHPPTAAKYWELGGKLSGYLGDENNQSKVNLFNIIAKELHIDSNDRASIPTQNIEQSIE